MFSYDTAETILGGALVGSILGAGVASFARWGITTEKCKNSLHGRMTAECLWLKADPTLGGYLEDLVNFYGSLDEPKCAELFAECNNLVRLLSESSCITASPTLVAEAAQSKRRASLVLRDLERAAVAKGRTRDLQSLEEEAASLRKALDDYVSNISQEVGYQLTMRPVYD